MAYQIDVPFLIDAEGDDGRLAQTEVTATVLRTGGSEAPVVMEPRDQEEQPYRGPAGSATPPSPEHKEIKTLSASEARLLLDAAQEDRLKVIYELALAAGLRQGELLALRWADVELDVAVLRVERSLQRTEAGLVFGRPKTRSSRRSIALSERAVRELRAHRVRQAEERLAAGPAWADLDLIFTTELGAAIDASNLRRRSFKPLLIRAGLEEIRFHDLRHTAATLMLQKGIHPKIVSEMLGHSKISTTLDVYTHVTPVLQREAAKAMDQLLG